MLVPDTKDPRLTISDLGPWHDSVHPTGTKPKRKIDLLFQVMENVFFIINICACLMSDIISHVACLLACLEYNTCTFFAYLACGLQHTDTSCRLRYFCGYHHEQLGYLLNSFVSECCWFISMMVVGFPESRK